MLSFHRSVPLKIESKPDKWLLFKHTVTNLDNILAETFFWLYNSHSNSHRKNAFESVLLRWMNLAPIMQSEVSQKEKDKYRILMLS